MNSSASVICILGAPGTGKGTQGKRLAQHLGGVHISVGEIVRSLAASGAKIPRDHRSRLVDTDFTAKLIVDAAEASPGPVLLDGFPRAAQQVAALQALPWACSVALWLSVGFPEAIARMKARGRAGEDISRIGMRHHHHEIAKPELRRALLAAGIRIHDINADGEIDEVQSACLAAIAQSVGGPLA